MIRVHDAAAVELKCIVVGAHDVHVDLAKPRHARFMLEGPQKQAPHAPITHRQIEGELGPGHQAHGNAGRAACAEARVEEFGKPVVTSLSPTWAARLT